MPNDDWVFWLNLTNIALGLIVVLAVLVTAFGLFWELVSRYKKSHSATNLDQELNVMMHGEFAHGLSVPELGMTMADGGEPTKPSIPEQPKDKKHNKA
jgi:hypothetical protein